MLCVMWFFFYIISCRLSCIKPNTHTHTFCRRRRRCTRIRFIPYNLFGYFFFTSFVIFVVFFSNFTQISNVHFKYNRQYICVCVWNIGNNNIYSFYGCFSKSIFVSIWPRLDFDIDTHTQTHTLTHTHELMRESAQCSNCLKRHEHDHHDRIELHRVRAVRL